MLPFENHPDSAPGRRGPRINFISQRRAGGRSQPCFAKKKKAPLSPLWWLQEAQPLTEQFFIPRNISVPFGGGNLPLVLVSRPVTPHLLSSRAAHSFRVSVSFLTTATPAEETRYARATRRECRRRSIRRPRRQGDHAGRGTQAGCLLRIGSAAPPKRALAELRSGTPASPGGSFWRTSCLLATEEPGGPVPARH